METHGARLKCCGFLKVLLLVQCISLCLLPGHCAAGSRGLSLPPCVLSQGHLCASGFPSSQALPPFTLYLRIWQTALEPICVQKCLRDSGTSLNILHVSTERFPSAPMGKGEGVPLLWPVKPLGSLYLLLHIPFPPLTLSEDGC